MQQNSATLIYDLNTMKGTTESYLKKIAQLFQTVQFQAWKITLSSESLEKTENCFEPPKVAPYSFNSIYTCRRMKN